MVRSGVIGRAAFVSVVGVATSLVNPECSSIDDLMPTNIGRVVENARYVNRGQRYSPIVFAISYGAMYLGLAGMIYGALSPSRKR